MGVEESELYLLKITLIFLVAGPRLDALEAGRRKSESLYLQEAQQVKGEDGRYQLESDKICHRHPE